MVKSVLGYWDRSDNSDANLCRWYAMWEVGHWVVAVVRDYLAGIREVRVKNQENYMVFPVGESRVGGCGGGGGCGVVEIIWERIDLPGILYGMEVADVDDRVMEQLEAIGSPYISSPYTYSHFMHFGSTLSHRRYYMNHISITCRFSHSGLSWSPVSHRSHLI